MVTLISATHVCQEEETVETLTIEDTRDRVDARRVLDAIPEDQEATLEVHVGKDEGGEIFLSPELTRIVLRTLSALADGGTVSIRAVPEVLSTTEAARTLGISRPTLMKMVRGGEIRATKVGTHTRLRNDDVLEFRAKREEDRAHAFMELRRLEDELDERHSTAS